MERKLKPVICLGYLGLALALGAQNAAPAQAGTVDFLFGAGSFGRKASPIADCRSLYRRVMDNRRAARDTSWRERVVGERSPRFLSDRDYLDEVTYVTNKLGSVDTRYLKDFDTRFYYTTTARPLADGTVPMVDPEARALVIYFHGSGTSKASGETFAGKANALARMNYSVLSFDLPFHRDGSRNPALRNTAQFAAYVDSIVSRFRQPGQPVILVGHSFGPDVIAEYHTRYPMSVSGIVLLSPGGWDKETRQWFAEKTVNMTKTFGEVEANNDGGMWAGQVTAMNTWNKPGALGRRDPSLVNPEARIQVVSGELEEYVPGPIDADGIPTKEPRTYDVEAAFRKFFKGPNVEVRIEPGVGHYIFAHTDERKQDVVLRSILRANGDSLADDEKALKAAAVARSNMRTPIDLLAGRYAREPFVRQWLDMQARSEGLESGQELLARLLQTGDKKAATKLTVGFNQVEKQRLEVLNSNIKATSLWAPAFYAENKDAIDKLGTKGFEASVIQSRYRAFLQTQPEDVIARHASAGESVFILPVKEAPQLNGERPMRQAKPLKASRESEASVASEAPAP